MWSDDDRIAKNANIEQGTYPKKCPVCGKDSLHVMMYQPEAKAFTGGCWIWCSSCKKYSHTSVVIPKWWRNYNGLEESQLFASPELNIDVRSEEIDKWVNKLISEKADDDERLPKTINDDNRFYVIKIKPQKILSEEKAELVEQICRCGRDEALKTIERNGFELHPMSATDTGIVIKELGNKGIEFSVVPDYKWNQSK